MAMEILYGLILKSYNLWGKEEGKKGEVKGNGLSVKNDYKKL